MPQVPSYGGPQVATEALRPVFQQPIDVSSGVQQASRALGQVGEAWERAQIQRDSDAALAAETKVKGAWLEADAKMRQQYAGNPDGYAEEAQKWWEQARGQATQALNPRAQALAGRSLGAFELQSRASTLGHVERERSAVRAQNYAANDDLTLQSALRLVTPQTAGTIGQATAQEIASSVAQYGATQGWSTERVQAEMLRRQSKLHSAVFTSLIEADPDAATRYLEASRDQIDAGMAGKFAAVAAEAGGVKKAQLFADTVDYSRPMAEVLVDVEKQFDGKREQIAKEEIRRRYADREASINDVQRSTYGRALLEVEQRGRVNPATFALLNDSYKAQILQRQKAEADEARRRATGTTAKTDWDTYLALRNQASEDAEKFVGTDLRRFVDKLAPREIEQLVDLQGQIRKAGKVPREVSTPAQQLKATADSLGIKDAKKRGLLTSEVMTEVAEQQAAKGKPLAFDEVQAIIDRAVMAGTVPGRVFGTNDRRAFEVPLAERGSFTPNQVPDAPAGEIGELNAELQRRGIAQTPANRLRLFQAAQRR